MNVLLVEDDAVLGRSVQRGLVESGRSCSWVTSAGAVFKALEEMSFDVVVLDLMLPDATGLEVLQKIKTRPVSPPVLVLTALGSLDERVEGLNAGADDYLVKPFAFAELIARLDAVCRRSVALVRNEIVIGPVVLDLRTRRATRDGKDIDLTPTEFTLLEFLMRHAGRVVSRRMLCEHLWDADWEGITNVIEVHINRLRTKIDRGFGHPLIHTVRGLGYAFREA